MQNIYPKTRQNIENLLNVINKECGLKLVYGKNICAREIENISKENLENFYGIPYKEKDNLVVGHVFVKKNKVEATGRIIFYDYDIGYYFSKLDNGKILTKELSKNELEIDFFLVIDDKKGENEIKKLKKIIYGV